MQWQKKPIFYFITGKQDVPVYFPNYFKLLSEKENEDEKRDCFFIIIKKPDASDAFVVSLKGIKEVKATYGNPLFQCNWNKCREPVNRSWAEARKFLLGKWAECEKKKLLVFRESMYKYYKKEFFGDINI